MTTQHPGSISPPQSVQPWFRCSECGALSAMPTSIVDLYIQGQSGTCPRCDATLNWWKVAMRMMRQNFLASEAFHLLGAKRTLFRTKIFRDTVTAFNLSEEGLPSNAVILDLNLTPDGMFCTEVTGNNRRLRNRDGRLQIHGFHISGSAGQTDEGVANILVTWVESSQDDAGWNSLVFAFDYYADASFETSIVPANVAVESRLFRFLEQHLSAAVAGGLVRGFLKSHATYHHQLNILLPMVVNHLHGAKLPDDLREKLNRLNTLRNQIAHEGRCKRHLSKDDCAEVLTAALFGFRYLGALPATAP